MVTDDPFEAMAARAGKREHALLLAISTPPKVADDGVMRRLVHHGRAGTDPSFYFREFAAPDGCEVDEAAWEVAKPALDDFLHRDALRRRPCRRRCARTPFAATGSASGCSWTARGHPMAPGRAAPTLGQHPDGAEVVLGFDGSFLGDCTALVAVTVADRPHVHLVKLWEAPEGSREWRVPLVEVEHAIRAACARWRPRGRRRPLPLATLAGAAGRRGHRGQRVPASPARMGPATARFYAAVVDRLLSHDGSLAALARHSPTGC